MSKWNKGREIGDSRLKHFTRGTLADNKPITDMDRVVYLLFVKGHKLSKIRLEFAERYIFLEEQRMYDMIRKVGLEYQTRYRKEINVPFDKPKIMFSEFVKGMALNRMAEDYQISPNELFTILRKVGLLYAQYLKYY